MHDPSSENPDNTALEALKLLSDETRWVILTALRTSDRPVSELAERLKLPANLISYHLGLLRQAGLVEAHRSEADARSLYYGLNLPVLERVYQQIGAQLHLPSPAPVPAPMPPVVFLCTENSARSQIAEGWLRQLSGGQVPARSAGVAPGELHPLAVQVMAEVGVDIGYQYAKGVEQLHRAAPGLVVTVCDRAREACPADLTAPIQLHWSIPDPARVARAGDQQLAAFRNVRDILRARVAGLLAMLPDLLANTLTP
ncbi:MAG: metalloregulator ArsR/SmtB family transcription factor [Roseiflexaceae bacterium]